MNFSQPEIWILGILLTILAWIGRQMISKMDALAKSLTEVDKNLAIISIKFDKHEDKVNYIEKQVQNNESSINDIKDDLHKIRNEINKVQLKDFS